MSLLCYSRLSGAESPYQPFLFWKFIEKEGNLVRVKIHLKCSSCGSQNYLTSKNSKTHPDKIEVLKYCPKERKVTLHLESK